MKSVILHEGEIIHMLCVRLGRSHVTTQQEHFSPPNRGLHVDILALDQRTQACVMVAQGTSFVITSKAMLFFRVKAMPTLSCPFYAYSKKSIRFNVRQVWRCVDT